MFKKYLTKIYNFKIIEFIQYFKLKIIILLNNKNCSLFWANLVKKYKLPAQIIEDNFTNFKKFLPYSDFKLDDNIIEYLILSDSWTLINQILFLKYQNISELIIEKHITKFDLNLILSFKKNLNEEFLYKFCNESNWSIISQKQNISDSFIVSNSNNINWYSIMCNPNLKLDFVIKYLSQIDINGLSRYVILNKKILTLLEDRLNWEIITIERLIPENILFAFCHKIDINIYSQSNLYHKDIIKYYSKDLILKFKPYFNNYYIYINRCLKIQKFLRKKELNKVINS